MPNDGIFVNALALDDSKGGSMLLLSFDGIGSGIFIMNYDIFPFKVCSYKTFNKDATLNKLAYTIAKSKGLKTPFERVFDDFILFELNLKICHCD